MKIAIIGAGIGGLGAANLLAQSGHQVAVYEKNPQLGGRISQCDVAGFRFDTGPTWYLMPDVIDRYFSLLSSSANQYLQLHRLNPTYRIYFSERQQPLDFFSDKRDLATAEKLEQGGGHKLADHLRHSARLYHLAIDRFLFRNYRSVLDLLSPDILAALPSVPFLTNIERHLTSRFSSPEMRKLLGYTTVFLGSSPYATPALYSFMSHVDLGLGAFYPAGGMYKLVEALHKIGAAKGVSYRLNTPVAHINIKNGKATGITLANGEIMPADAVISNADITHTEASLLDQRHRSYTRRYWRKRTLAPSVFLMFLGINKKLPQLRHHTLIFSRNWEKNFTDIFDRPQWPQDPSLYICAASRTDATAAPPGCEGIYLLVPIAAGLSDTPAERLRYRNHILKLLEQRLNEPGLASHVIYEKIVGPTDYAQLFNVPQGTAFGFSHNLSQTIVFRPKNKSAKVSNLYYTGAGTHPGIGLPTCLVSAELTTNRLLQEQRDYFTAE